MNGIRGGTVDRKGLISCNDGTDHGGICACTVCTAEETLLILVMMKTWVVTRPRIVTITGEVTGSRTV